MNWVKRNLMLVMIGSVAFILLAGAGYYLFAGMAHHAHVSQELETAKAELQRLYTANPSPIEENVKLAVEDQVRVEKLLNDAKTKFAGYKPAKYDIASFKKLLDNTIYELTREADAAKVRLPEKYNFTFEIQKSAVSFTPGSIVPMAARLEDIKAICNILYSARVHSIDGMRRIIVSPDDREGSADYLLQKPATNELAQMVRIPYEVTFTGFSQELAAVMDGMSAAPQFFVVRDVWVSPAPVVVAALATAVPTRQFIVTGAVPGVPTFPGRPPTPAAANPCDGCCNPCPDCCCNPTPQRPALPANAIVPRVVYARPAIPNTILNERLLRFTLMFEIIVPVSEATMTIAPVGSASASPAVVPPAGECL